MLTVRTYEELRRRCGHFENGPWTCLVVVGDPGVGKSRTMAEALPKANGIEVEGARWIGAHVSAFQMYRELHAHRNRTFVLDDVDSLCRDANVVSLLKCLCDTETTRRIFWTTSNRDLEREGIPREFDTTSKVAILTNTWATVDANVGALENRAQVLRFAPPSAEVHRHVGTWFRDKRVYEYIGGRIDRIMKPSQRLYSGALNERSLGEDWKGWVEHQIALPDELQVVKDLRDDTSYTAEEQRVQRYTALTGKSRASYFRVVADLKSLEASNTVVATKPKLPPRKRASLPVTPPVELTLRKAAKVATKPDSGGTHKPTKLTKVRPKTKIHHGVEPCESLESYDATQAISGPSVAHQAAEVVSLPMTPQDVHPALDEATTSAPSFSKAS